MAMMQGRNPVEFDAAAKTLLANAVTHTDTRTANTAIVSDLLTNAFWDDPSQLPGGLMWVNINVTANTVNGGGDTVAFALEAHTSSDFSSARTELGRVTLTDSTTVDGLKGLYRFAVDSKTAKKLIADATHFALVSLMSDAAAGITYSAWLGFAKQS